MNKFQQFLADTYPTKSYYAILRKFLNKQLDKGNSIHTTERIFYNLYPLGEELENPQYSNITRQQIREYIRKRWSDLARDTMRTLIGDLRHLCKWCKKKGYHSQNLAKKIKPIKQKHRRRRRRQKAAHEQDIEQLMKHLASQLKGKRLVYQGIFKELCIEQNQMWTKTDIMVIRDLFMITFFYETGARVGELAELETKAIERETSQPETIYTITVYGKEDDVDYHCTERTAELWRIWQQVRPHTQTTLAVVGWKHEPEPIKPSGISQMVYRRCKQAGIKRPFRANALRHAKIKRSRKIVGIETTSILVDHENVDTTWNYANIEDDEIAQAALKTGLQYNIWE